MALPLPSPLRLPPGAFEFMPNRKRVFLAKVAIKNMICQLNTRHRFADIENLPALALMEHFLAHLCGVFEGRLEWWLVMLMGLG